MDTSAMTLLQLEQHLLGNVTGRSQKLALLQVLAVMCEGLPHTLLLRKPTQVTTGIHPTAKLNNLAPVQDWIMSDANS